MPLPDCAAVVAAGVTLTLVVLLAVVLLTVVVVVAGEAGAVAVVVIVLVRSVVAVVVAVFAAVLVVSEGVPLPSLPVVALATCVALSLSLVTTWFAAVETLEDAFDSVCEAPDPQPPASVPAARPASNSIVAHTLAL